MEPRDDPAFREPPEGFRLHSADRVIAVMDDPGEVVAGIDDLAHRGFDRDEIFVFCGPRGAERLVESGHPRGILGRMYRLVERVLGEEPEEEERYASEIAAGRFVISVPADEGRKTEVAEVLASHGAHDMEHFGRFHGEPLGSPPGT